jgi:hypothetical protein
LPVKPGECLRYACGATGARRRIQARAGITGWKPAGPSTSWHASPKKAKSNLSRTLQGYRLVRLDVLAQNGAVQIHAAAISRSLTRTSANEMQSPTTQNNAV